MVGVLADETAAKKVSHKETETVDKTDVQTADESVETTVGVMVVLRADGSVGQ